MMLWLVGRAIVGIVQMSSGTAAGVRYHVSYVSMVGLLVFGLCYCRFRADEEGLMKGGCHCQ